MAAAWGADVPVAGPRGEVAWLLGSAAAAALVETAAPDSRLFADGGWDKINTTILSTSNCGNPSLRQFGFGPTSADGFGIGYIIKDGSISICASSKHRQTKRFIDAIESYFLEIRKLLRMTQRRGTSIDKGASRAREAEEKFGRSKNRGKAIADTSATAGGGKREQQDNAAVSSDDDEMGGCKFFLFFPLILIRLLTFSHQTASSTRAC